MGGPMNINEPDPHVLSAHVYQHWRSTLLSYYWTERESLHMIVCLSFAENCWADHLQICFLFEPIYKQQNLNKNFFWGPYLNWVPMPTQVKSETTHFQPAFNHF